LRATPSPGLKIKDCGWDTLSNGDLLAEAERAGFDVFLTADKNIQYQQNLAGRRIAVVVLSIPQWPLVKLHIEKLRQQSTRPCLAAMRKFIFRTSRDAGAALCGLALKERGFSRAVIAVKWRERH